MAEPEDDFDDELNDVGELDDDTLDDDDLSDIDEVDPDEFEDRHAGSLDLDGDDDPVDPLEDQHLDSQDA